MNEEMMQKIDLDQILKEAGSVGISGHIRPDGDCIGSCLGLYHYVRLVNSDADCKIFLDPLPDTFLFLKDADKISCDRDTGLHFDVFFVLDCSGGDRLGESAALLNNADRVICIDHHVTADTSFGNMRYIDPDASSTSELVCRLIEPDRISKDIAEALYTGIVHDTGVFQYSCTSSETMRLAGILMDKGIDFSKIVNDTFFSKTYAQNRILGKALFESRSLLGGRVIVSVISRADMQLCGVGPKDLDGISSQLRTIKGVDTAVFLYETNDGEWKASLRSSELVDVASVASCFGGGGHVRAAGCTMCAPAEEVVNILINEIEKQVMDV